MGSMLAKIWRRLRSAWQSRRRSAPPRFEVDTDTERRAGELGNGGNRTRRCAETGAIADATGAREEPEDGAPEGGGRGPRGTRDGGVEPPAAEVPHEENEANDGERTEQEWAELEGAEPEQVEQEALADEPAEQESAHRVPVEAEIVGGEQDKRPPDVDPQAARKQRRRKRAARGGARVEAREKNSPGAGGRSGRLARVARARIVCRKRGGRWEVAVVPAPGVVVRGEAEDGAVRASGEFGPTVFRSVAVIDGEAGGQSERVPLYVDEPMVFRSGADWQGEGRKVGGVGVGHFIVIAPAGWTRRGDAPVDPEACVDAEFRAHYFFADRRDGPGGHGFEEHGVSSSVIALDGDHVFDDSEQGELFIGKPPTLTAPGMDLARVGEEGKQGWGQFFALDGGRSLADVLDGREGRFFVRVYREGAGVEADSVQFRYLAGLREIRLNGEAYAADTVLSPTPRGHLPADVEIVAAEDARVEIEGVTDGTREFEVEAGTVVCPADPETRQLRFRMRGGVDVVVGLPRVWWRLVTPGEPGEPWRDRAQSMKREEFRSLGLSGAEMRIDAPERIPRVRVGFGDESAMNYRVRKEGSRRCCAVPLGHYLDHVEIDQRLFRDAALEARFGEAVVDVIGIAADPWPRIIDFSVGCGRVSPGDSVGVQWRVEDCDGVTVSLEPGVGPVGAEGSREIQVDRKTVATLTLTAAGMEDVVEERVIEVKEAEPESGGRLDARAKANGGWRPAKGFSVGELAAVQGAGGLPIRADRRRRSVHAINVALLERWANGQR